MMTQNLEEPEAAATVIVPVESDEEGFRRFPCGDEYAPRYWDEQAIVAHPVACKACRVIMGSSRANVGDQSFVASTFCAGIDGKRSQRRHLSSDSGVLVHYSTIAAVRTRDEKIIQSTQDWSAGFATVAHLPRVEARLPLSTLRVVLEPNERSSQKLRDIEVLDELDGTTLFRYMGRFLLYGERDGERWTPWLCELPGPARDVLGAFVSLKPHEVQEAVYNGIEVRRHGEFDLIPGQPTADELEFVSERAHYKQNAGTKFERQLVRPRIMGSNHTAGEVLEVGPKVFARGTIRHERNEHAPLKLGDQWHQVFRNLAVGSWRVERRGFGGGVD